MTDLTDWQLIRRYAGGDKQAAFSALVRRHTDLVYCTCLRELRELPLAEDAAQAVFLILARKAPSFRPGTTLSSWLFQTALLTSKNVSKRERRRQARERRLAAEMEALEMERTMPPRPSGWEQMEPVLNEALEALPTAQRGLVLERFLEGRPLAEIGAALGISEDAARMRLNRALDRLRRFFAARNVALSAAALAALLPLAVHPAPARCAESILRLALPPAAFPAPDSPVHVIAQGAIHTMNLKRLRLHLGAAALVAVLSISATSAVRVHTQVKARAALAAKRSDQARALAVLDRMYATYAAMHSFRCNVSSREDPLGTAQDADYEIQRPNKLRFRRVTLIGPDLSGQAHAVSDGTSLYVTCTENKGLVDHYAKMPSAGTADHNDWMADFGGLPAWGAESRAGMPSVALGLTLRPSSQLSPPEYSMGQPTVIDFSGVPLPVSLDVVIARMSYHAGAPGRDWKGAAEVVTYYIGRRDHLLYKLTAADPLSPTDMDTRTELINGIEVNPKLPPSDFVFTPPPGGHEVHNTSDLFLNGRM